MHLASSTNTAPGIMVLRGLRDKRQLQTISLRLLVRKQCICQRSEGRSRLGAEHSLPDRYFAVSSGWVQEEE